METIKKTFTKLYMNSYEKLFRTAFRLTGGKEEAEDIVQDTFLDAYKAYNSFRKESSFETWVFRILLNNSYKHIKKRKNMPLTDYALKNNLSEKECYNNINSFNNSIENLAMLNDIKETCIQLFFECIPKKQRIAYTLRVFMNFSIKDTAEIMGINPNSVKVYVHRAKKHLENNIDGKCSLLNPNNPCKCQNWLNYIIESGNRDKVPEFHIINKKSSEEIQNSIAEINALKRYAVLYDNVPEHMSREEFFKKIKKIINDKTLKIFT